MEPIPELSDHRGTEDRPVDDKVVDAVFVFPYPSFGDTFRFPAIFACCSGELRARGLSTMVVELYLDGSVTTSSDLPALRELAELLEHLRPRVVVLSDLFEGAIPVAVRAACDCVLVCTDPGDPEREGVADWFVRSFETNPVPLVKLVESLVSGMAVDSSSNTRRSGSSFVGPVESCSGVPMFVARPDYDFKALPSGIHRPSERLSVYVNPGCPWAIDVGANPVYEGVDLTGTGLASRGCSFCLQNGRYAGLDASATVDRIVLELQSWMNLHPGCRDVVVWDESPWRFLGLLSEL